MGDEKTQEVSKEEVVLRVFMHCEGCARKIRRCLKGFQGVEDVETDCKTHVVVVKGEKADPIKVLERVQTKTHRPVELLSPLPKPPADEQEAAKPQEKKQEAPEVITVVLKVYMHCEACAQEIRKRILKMKGVESAEPDLNSSHVAVKGTFAAPELIDFVYKRTGKHAAIVNQAPPPKKPEDDDQPKIDDDAGEAAKPEAAAPPAQGDTKPIKNEFYYNYYQPQNYQIYPPRYVAGPAYAPAPEMFSDENPNACSVM